MAQSDIIDLDALLDEHEAGLLAQSAAQQAQQAAAETKELDKLTEHGYETPPPSRGGQFSPLRDYAADERAKREARRTGILADDPYAVEHWLPGARAQTKAEYTGVDFTGGAEGKCLFCLQTYRVK